MRTYQVNRPTAGKARSTGSNVKVSARLCSVPCRCGRGSRFTKARPAPFPLSAHRLHARPPLLLCGRGTSAYANLLDSFVGCVRTRGIDKAMGRDRVYFFCFARRPHPLATQYSLRLSRVCGRSLKEERLPLFVFFVLFGQAKSTWCLLLLCKKVTAIYLFTKPEAGKTHLRLACLDDYFKYFREAREKY